MSRVNRFDSSLFQIHELINGLLNLDDTSEVNFNVCNLYYASDIVSVLIQWRAGRALPNITNLRYAATVLP